MDLLYFDLGRKVVITRTIKVLPISESFINKYIREAMLLRENL